MTHIYSSGETVRSTTIGASAYPPNFTFDASLDRNYLNEFYQGDLHQASLMFEVFLTVTVRNFQNMQGCFHQKRWEQVQQLAHKMKPSFDIVGLSRISSQLLRIDRLEISLELPLFIELVNSVIEDFNRALPNVMTQKHALDKMLNSWSN